MGAPTEEEETPVMGVPTEEEETEEAEEAATAEEEAAEEGTNRRRSGTNIEHTVSSIYLSIFVSLSEARAPTCCRS